MKITPAALRAAKFALRDTPAAKKAAARIVATHDIPAEQFEAALAVRKAEAATRDAEFAAKVPSTIPAPQFL